MRVDIIENLLEKKYLAKRVCDETFLSFLLNTILHFKEKILLYPVRKSILYRMKYNGYPTMIGRSALET